MKKKFNYSWLISILPFGLIILAIIVFFKPLKDLFSGILSGSTSLLETVGLKQSDAQKNIQANVGIIGNAFDPNFYKSARSGTILPSSAHAIQICTDIHDAIVGSLGWSLFVDYNKCLAIFEAMPNQAYVSLVASFFAQQYQADMLQWMGSPGNWRFGLNETTLNQIVNRVNNLPKN